MRSSIATTLIFLLGFLLGSTFFATARKANELDAVVPDIRRLDVSLTCLGHGAIEAVRKSGSVDALVPACEHELRTVLGDDFGKIDQESLRVVLATVVAANFADYGPNSAITFEDIKQSKYLNCGNTTFLVGYLFGTLNSKRIMSVGFDGGVVGNHAQLIYSGKHDTILLDPTTGLIAQTDFNDLLRGNPVRTNKIRSFSIKDKSINTFRQRVYLAVRDGEYDPSDFMFMHESLREQFDHGMLSRYFSPGAIKARNE